MAINANDGQNKLELLILRNMAGITNYLPKIGHGPGRHFCANLKRHMVIFHPIFTFDHTKIISSSRQIEWRKLYLLSSKFLFFGPFCSVASHEQHWAQEPKTTPTRSSKSLFTKNLGVNPPFLSIENDKHHNRII